MAIAPNHFFLYATLMLIFAFASPNFTGAQIGIAYGRNEPDLPPPSAVVQLFKDYNITRMRIYDTDPETLKALCGSSIELTAGILNMDLQELAGSQSDADSWVQTNVQNHPDVNFCKIVVGNEVFPINGDTAQYVDFVLPAMRNIRTALDAANLGQIMVTTAVGTAVLEDDSYPPSKGDFRPELRRYLDPIVKFLVETGAPMLASIYPYFAYVGGMMKEAEDVLQNMKKQNINPNIVSYNRLIDGYCKQGRVDEAWHLFLEIPCKGLKHDTCSYNVMMHGLFGKGRFVDGWKLFKDMEARDISPNIVTFNTLLDALCKNKEMDEAASLLHMIEEKGLSPNLITYTTVLDGLCKLGKLDLARDLFNKLQPNIVSYSCLIDGYCKQGRLSEAWLLFCEVPSKGLEHNTCTYTNMIHGFFSEGNFVDGWKLFNDMAHRGVSPNIFTYNVLIHGLCKNWMIDEAFSLPNMIERKGVNPNVVTYGTLISGLSKNGNHDVARALFNELPHRGLQPDVRMYTMIIASLCQEGSTEEANSLLVEMENRGCAPDGFTDNKARQYKNHS